MEIKKQYLQKYLHDIAIDQIAEEYKEKGYVVSKEEQLGKKYYADLIARKDNETIVVEVKSGKMSPERKQKISDLANYVRGQGNYKFLVVIATPPKEKKLEIIGIENLLTEYFSENLPSELDELSTHTTFDEVTDVDIDEILIDGDSILVTGDGVVSVELQLGSDGDQNADDGFTISDSFPFEFGVKLEYDIDHGLKIIDFDNLEVDTSSYYE